MLAKLFAGLGLSLTLLPVLPSLPVAAASFDCSKASTVHERLICGNEDLSSLDEVLAKAYATATGGLSKPALAEMRDNQRGWLDYAARACTADAEPQQADYTEDQFNCVHSNLYNRIRELEQSRMLDGRRFYMVEEFSVLKADQQESGSTFNTVATKVYSSPRIDGDDTTAVEFNTFADNLLQTVMAGAIEGGGPSDRTSDIDTRLKVTAATSSRIAITTTDWWYGHGAAHGNYTVTHAHFLVADGRPLVVDDVFATENWVEPVAELTHAALKQSLGEYLWEDLEGSLKEWVAQPERWNFSSEGLIIQFQPYEVTAYAAGAPTVTIPWGAIEKFTTGTIYGVVAY